MPTLKIQRSDGSFDFLQLAGEEFADIGNQVLALVARVEALEAEVEALKNK